MRSQIIDELPGLVDPVRRQANPQGMAPRGVFAGPYLERFPDLIVEADYPDMFKPHGAYRGRQAARRLTTVEMTQRAITGCHRMNGVFIAWGPDVTPGGRLSDAALINVAPTVLHLLGQPIPAEMDGHA